METEGLDEKSVVAFDTSASSATCTIPMAALRIRTSGIVRWQVFARYITGDTWSAFRRDHAPDVGWYPHL